MKWRGGVKRHEALPPLQLVVGRLLSPVDVFALRVNRGYTKRNARCRQRRLLFLVTPSSRSRAAPAYVRVCFFPFRVVDVDVGAVSPRQPPSPPWRWPSVNARVEASLRPLFMSRWHMCERTGLVRRRCANWNRRHARTAAQITNEGDMCHGRRGGKRGSERPG